MVAHACDPSLGEQGKLDSVAFKPVSLSELLISILGDTPHIIKEDGQWRKTPHVNLCPQVQMHLHTDMYICTHTHM